jgi:uncharacterized protein involved in outer membrane biogenesis
MSRALKIGLIAGVALVVSGGAFLWALPEIVRRVALDQIPKRTGRAAALEDVDLNLFTGHLALKKFRLAEREGPETFVELERLDVRLSLPALLRSHLHAAEIVLVAPSMRVVRTRPGEFNFSDLLAAAAGPSAGAEAQAPAPKPWTITVRRLALSRGRVRVEDRGIAPPAEWLIDDLRVDATDITTRAGAKPGRLAVHARIDEAVLDVTTAPLRLEPLLVSVKVTLDAFETKRLTPYVYVPLRTPYRPVGGRLALALEAKIDSDAGGISKAMLTGTATLEREALAQLGRDEPFVSAARLGVDIGEADLLGRTLRIASVAIEGLDLKARRDADGAIDLLEMFKPKPVPAAPTAAAPQAPSPPPGAPAVARSPPGPSGKRELFPIIQALARGFEQIRIDRITLAPSRAAFIDEAVRPTTTLALTKLQARVDDLTWPPAGPATLALSTELPGAGSLDIKGPVTAQPLDAVLTFALRDARIEPYQAYIPVPARLSGRFNGDSTNRIAFRDGGMVLASRGNSWAQNVEVRAPGAERPTIRVERMELIGVDFDWPRRAAFVKASLRRPRVELERDADGEVNLRRLFTPPDKPAPQREAPELPPRPREGPKPRGLLETMQLEFKEVRIEDGFIRFLDRTTTPAFSQDLSRFELTVTSVGNQPDRRARLALQSLVGGDAGLDFRGEVNAIGAPAFVDLVGELRRFKLASVDPYMASNIGWVIKKGELEYKVRFKLEGDQLSAQNEVVVGQLQVAPHSGADEVKRRIGLPLGLIVALVKDQRGDIRVSVPVAGTVSDPKFSLGDAIWTALKNVLVNVVTAPFKAIGRLFSSGEKLQEPRVDPVTFAAGSSVLSPAMEDHLLRVADFLRRSPFVDLALKAVPSPADVEALKGEVVTARLREFQTARGLPDAGALAGYYKQHLPEVPLPATVEEQLALLRQREPVPDARVAELGRRRLDATRERLIKAEGIPADRLTPGDVPASSSPGAPTPAEGRIEFGIVPGGGSSEGPGA